MTSPMPKIAIMQGRLGPPEAGRFQSFPIHRWREEFPAAARAGLDAIEWIYDDYGHALNPIASDDGLREIQSLSARHNVQVVSLCADYFMDHPVVRGSAKDRVDLFNHFVWLIGRCKAIGITRIVIPFVDASKMLDEKDQAIAAQFITDLIPTAGSGQVELHLETDLPPLAFAQFLRQIQSPWVKANYDSGNSSGLGYRPQEEFEAYGDRVGSVHIKDRLLGGTTVPLGTGDADLPAVVACLNEVGYKGDFVLQVARAEPGGEIDWSRQNKSYLENLIRSTARTGVVE